MTRPDQPHLCYVHSPVRYAWDEQFYYLRAGRHRLRAEGPAVPLHAAPPADLGHAHRARAGPDAGQLQLRPRRASGTSTAATPASCIRRSPSASSTAPTDKDDYYVSAVLPRALQAHGSRHPRLQRDAVAPAGRRRRRPAVGRLARARGTERHLRRIPAARGLRADHRRGKSDGFRRLRGFRHRARRGAGMRHAA